MVFVRKLNAKLKDWRGVWGIFASRAASVQGFVEGDLPSCRQLIGAFT
jgi:hypothetical protein